MAHDLGPDEFVELVGPGRGLGAAQLLLAQVHGQHGLAAVVAVLAPVGVGLAARRSCLAALSAADQIAQQVALGADVAGTEAGVELVARLGTGPNGGVDDRGHSHADPLFLGLGGLEGTVTGGMAWDPGAVGELGTAVVVEGAGVSLLAQHPVKGRCLPHRVPSRARDASLDETDGDLAHRDGVVHVPVEDQAHNFGFSFVDHQARRQPVGGGDLAIAVGDDTGHDRSLAGPPQLASPVALDDLGPLEFGHRRLDLGEESPVGVVGHAALDEHHRYFKSGQLIEHQRLVHVVAGQAVGAQHDDGVDEPSSGRVADPVETRPVQSRPREAVIGAGHLDRPALGGSLDLERLELRADRPLLLLAVSGHPRVQRNSHRIPPAVMRP